MSEKWIIVTGGAGFIGSHLCKNLIDKGKKVICLDNLITGTKKNIKNLIENKRFRFVEHDVSKFISISEDLEWVLHLASPASPSDYLKYPIQTLKVGALGTHNTLGLALAKKAKFLLASTSEVYGDPLVNPQPEDYWGNVNPVGPRGVYDEAKRFAEAMVMAYHHYHGIDTRIIRIFNTYGPKMRRHDGRAVPEFINLALEGKPLTIFGDGKQTRSFCYIDDMIKGILKVMDSNINNPINLGNPNEMSILDLALKIRDKINPKLEIVYKDLPLNDPKVRRPDISLARKELNWEPKVPLDEGLDRTIEYFSTKN